MLTATYADCHILALCAECHFAECRYAECHYAECRGAFCNPRSNIYKGLSETI